MKANELREKYLSFFETKGCVRRPSDVLVPRWDPSVLFTPAGMNQFKDHFLGRVKLDFTRATTCQKCLRTGDIDNVGRTAYHHTFFEMLGNFSFGDYFKREAIHWAWEFLTDKKWLGLPPELLSATVYKDDEEAANIWLDEIGLPANHLKHLEEDENFWPASAPSEGPDGVCGPCSEIYYQTKLGEVEIWNLVFTQFNRKGNPPNNLFPLPSKNIDTGMGLERTAAALQGVETNFHIDILKPLVLAAGEVCGVEYNDKDLTDENGRRLRRIADHVRACTFAVHENVYPGNKEEKYVIRRLLRRAVLDGFQMKKREPFLFELVPVVADLMKAQYPELGETIERVQQVIRSEEDHFLGTIDGGLGRIENVFGTMASGAVVSGKDAFEMYQTYGFPPELFETLAADRGFGFDWDGFHKEMAHHGELSGLTEKNLLFKKDPLENLKKTTAPPEFLGYQTLTAEDAKILAILKDGAPVDAVSAGGNAKLALILDRTPFYAEKGGQVGDTGVISGANFKFTVNSTTYDGQFQIHAGTLTEGNVKSGETVKAEVDIERRMAISRAHSATHLIHLALRTRLGSHAEQQGSKVRPDELHFDFTHHQSVDRETLDAIETDVNKMIMADLPVTCNEMPIDDARKVGAMMLFGEKYPDIVRVVVMGDSKELCGGTHLTRTGQIGFCKLVSDESVSAGTRRITAVTGIGSLNRIRKMETTVQTLAGQLKVKADDVLTRVTSILADQKKLAKEIEALKRQGSVSADELLKEAKTVGSVNAVLKVLQDQDTGALRDLIDAIRQKSKETAVMLANVDNKNSKVTLFAAFSKDLLSKGFNAVDWVKSASKKVQGGGGGRPDLAQAGGKNPAGAADAIAEAEKWLAEK